MQFRLELHESHASAKEHARIKSAAAAFLAAYRAECENAGVPVHAAAERYLRRCFKGQRSTDLTPFYTPRKAPYPEAHGGYRTRKGHTLEAARVFEGAMAAAVEAGAKRTPDGAAPVADADVELSLIHI